MSRLFGTSRRGESVPGQRAKRQRQSLETRQASDQALSDGCPTGTGSPKSNKKKHMVDGLAHVSLGVLSNIFQMFSRFLRCMFDLFFDSLALAGG